MTRIALIAGVAASLLFAGGAHAETKPAEKPATQPKAAKPAPKPAAKATAAKRKRVTYACDGGMSLVVTYPPEAQAKTGRLKVATKDTTYFLRPVAGAGDKYENKGIKMVFETKGEEATLAREGKPLAEKCKTAQPAAKPGG